MKKKRHSIKDIAKELKVSTTTVSFVLNGKAKQMGISEKLADRIIKYTDLIGYKPNQLAKSLRTGKSKIIVFMVEDIANYFFAKIARLIEDMAYERGYKVLFCSNENNDQKSKDLINLFKERNVDGYIIIPSPGIKGEIANLLKEGIPVVLFDRYFPELETDYVVINNELASYNATKHLIENDFHKIGFITINTDQIQMFDRKKGYQRAIQEEDLEENILEIDYTNSETRNKELIKSYFQTEELDAVYFAANYLTQYGLEVIKNGFPEFFENKAVITFDDHDFFRIHSPSISAISQPREDLARNLMDLMLSQLENSELAERQIVLNANLRPRESTLKKSR
ncbi:MAG: LacI family DNA-binding transcriptional regulator [Salegentibacter mishustinae]|nr:LacI family DNA-binding transcriptional regulator [Salegentibacter mishustinae]